MTEYTCMLCGAELKAANEAEAKHNDLSRVRGYCTACGSEVSFVEQVRYIPHQDTSDHGKLLPAYGLLARLLESKYSCYTHIPAPAKALLSFMRNLVDAHMLQKRGDSGWQRYPDHKPPSGGLYLVLFRNFGIEGARATSYYNCDIEQWTMEGIYGWCEMPPSMTENQLKGA